MEIVKKFYRKAEDIEGTQYYHSLNPVSIFEICWLITSNVDVLNFNNSEIGKVHRRKQLARNMYTFHSLTQTEFDQLVQFVNSI